MLKEVGVNEIQTLPHLHFPEYCEDCDAPFFPDPSGEFVHAGLQEGDSAPPAHFH
jgi:hypothetical protein